MALMDQRRVGEDATRGRIGRRLRIAGLLVLALIACALGVRYVGNVFDADYRSGGTALSDYLAAGLRVQDGDLYAFNFAYPPVFAVAMSPLSALPRPVAATIWYVGQVLAIAGIFLLSRRLLALCEVPRPRLVLALAFVVGSRFLLNNLSHGNVNSFVLLLALVAAVDLARDGQRATGIALGAAASIKLLPLIFLPVLLLRGSRKAAAWMAVTVLALNVVLPVALLGVDRSVELSRAWYEKMVSPYAENPVASYDERNLALSTVLERHVLGDPVGRPTAEPGILDSDVGRWIINGVLGLVALLTLASVWRNRGRERRWAALHDVSVVLASLLLLSPKTWTAHYVWIVPAVLLLAARCGGSATGLRRHLLRAAFLLAAAVLVFGSRGFIGKDASEALRSAAVPALCVVLVWFVALASPPAVARRPDPDEPLKPAASSRARRG